MGKCLGCSCCVFFVALIVYFAMSMSSLPVNTWGIDYSPITKTVNPNIYDSGFHMIGFMHKFIEYPSQVQSIDFSDDKGNDRDAVESRSIDGLQVKFSVQFQYTLQKSNLIDLYLRYGEEYKPPCIRYAVDILNDKATQFTASQFFNDLGSVQVDMQRAMVTTWERECFATITTLQVTKAKLPYAYEQALQAT